MVDSNSQDSEVTPSAYPTTEAEASARLDVLIGNPPSGNSDATLQDLAWMIDASEDLQREDGISAALSAGDAILNEDLTATQRALLHYFLSNAWESRRTMVRSGWELHEWEQPELERQIVHLRLAVAGGEDSGLDLLRLCQMHTNLGNLLSHCGRVIDAIRSWNRALAIDSGFEMALGNRGYGLLHYGELVHDPMHKALFFRAAFRDLTTALSAGRYEIHPQARQAFGEALTMLTAAVPIDILQHPSHDHFFPKRMGKRELEYRRWCLKNRLFLNDLNDLGEDPLAARDNATLPGIVTPIGTGIPHAVGFYNQLKQEYASARYFYYEGVTVERPHFSDRQVLLANTFDYPAYGISTERVKAAFRVAYSLLDKIAYFLNDFLSLGISESRVSFRSLWYERQDRTRGLRADLSRPESGPLKALFWLAKDLYEKEQGFQDAMEPDAREIATLRNHLEHKYLKLHLFGTPVRTDNFSFDALAFSLDRAEFEQRTIRLLQLAREALLYLAMVVGLEEYRRRDGKDDSQVFTREMDIWEDRWKV